MDEARDAVDDEVGPLDDLRRALVGAHADAHGARRARPSSASSSSASKASRSVASSPPNSAARDAGARDQRRAPPGPCRSAPAGGPRAPCVPSGWRSRRPRPPGRGPPGASRAASSSGAPRQWKATIGPLSSMRTRRRRSSGVSRSPAKRRTRSSQLSNAGITRGVGGARLEQLGAVRAGVGDAADADEPARLGDRAPGDAGHAGRSGGRAGRAEPRPPRAPAPPRRGRTIGASTPSMSQKIAAAPGSSVSGRSASARASSVGAGTAIVCPAAERGTLHAPSDRIACSVSADPRDRDRETGRARTSCCSRGARPVHGRQGSGGAPARGGGQPPAVISGPLEAHLPRLHRPSLPRHGRPARPRRPAQGRPRARPGPGPARVFHHQPGRAPRNGGRPFRRQYRLTQRGLCPVEG